MKRFQIFELGLTFPFIEESSTEKVLFRKSYIYTHTDEKWRNFPGNPSFYKELLTVDIHSATHIDALNHRADNLKGYNQVKYDKPATYLNGADNIPTISGNAVLLDIALYLHMSPLNPEKIITADILDACSREQNINWNDIDVVLIRTGHITLWKQGQYDRYLEKEAGLNLEAASWIADKNVMAVGADNFAIEKIPSEEGFFPVHKLFLVEKGIYIIENLDLEILSSNNIYSFYFIGTPIRFKTASGAFMNPVAILKSEI